jgi:uncharacterized membrane protein required for colicin V production
MTIWLLALILMASLAGVGYRQGAIRVGFSLAGIFLGALLAVPLGKLVQPLLKAVGVSNPILLGTIGSFVVFVVVLIAFKIAGLMVHQKVDVFYKYKAGDLRLALFNRLNARLGLCLGLVNGLAYLILISFVAYAFSYWTVQMASSDEDPRGMRTLNRLGRDLQSTGMSRVARAIDPIPDAIYDAADVVGIIYHNPLIEARLSRYPGFLSIGLKPEFQDLGQDSEFSNLRLRAGTTIKELLEHPKVQTITQKPELVQLVWDTLLADLKDLRRFLETGKSDKYDSERILGRWHFDVNSTVSAYRRTRANVPQPEMLKLRRLLTDRYTKATLAAAPDNHAVIEDLPALPADGVQTLDGRWRKLGEEYELEFAGGTDKRTGKIENFRLTLSGSEGWPLVFVKEDY